MEARLPEKFSGKLGFLFLVPGEGPPSPRKQQPKLADFFLAILVLGSGQGLNSTPPPFLEPRLPEKFSENLGPWFLGIQTPPPAPRLPEKFLWQSWFLVPGEGLNSTPPPPAEARIKIATKLLGSFVLGCWFEGRS